MIDFIKKTFETLMSFQTLLLVFYILINFENLDSIPYSINLFGTTYEFTINMYEFTAIIIVIFTVIVAIGVYVSGLGANDSTSALVAKYVAISTYITLLNVPLQYYLQLFGMIGTILNVIFGLIYLLYFLSSTSE
jgi:hypothetical protein